MNAAYAHSFSDPEPADSTVDGFPARWMSAEHAACYLQVSASTVRRWARIGRLRSKLVMRGRAFSSQVLVPLYSGEPTCGCGGGGRHDETRLLRLLDGATPPPAGRPPPQERTNGRHAEAATDEGPYEQFRWLAKRARRRGSLPWRR